MEFVPPAPPSDMDFARWLRERTPPDAPTILILAPGARSAVELPQIRPAVTTPTSRRFRRRRGSAPAVHAAYLADVEGISPRRLVSSGLFNFSSDRTARHHVRDGRLTAADLGVWPWAVVDGKPLPRNWWVDPDLRARPRGMGGRAHRHRAASAAEPLHRGGAVAGRLTYAQRVKAPTGIEPV